MSVSGADKVRQKQGRSDAVLIRGDGRERTRQYIYSKVLLTLEKAESGCLLEILHIVGKKTSTIQFHRNLVADRPI